MWVYSEATIQLDLVIQIDLTRVVQITSTATVQKTMTGTVHLSRVVVVSKLRDQLQPSQKQKSSLLGDF